MTNIEQAIDKLRALRRQYSSLLMATLETASNYECEDIIRLTGHLQASYDHLLASRAHDGDLYCVLGKHLPAALILAGEIGIEVGPIYEIMSILTAGKIEPCSACKQDKEEADNERI